MPCTPSELAAAIDAGRPVKFLFFWGHQPNRDGSVGKGCLSQWWPAPFTVEGRSYATAEHYMMWSKAVLFDDHEIAERILAAGHPKQVKDLGRAIGGFDEQTWVRERYGIVVAGNLAKFGQHADLRAFLLGTGERVLVEASPRDAIWGIGLSQHDDRASEPANWPGRNLLGFALTEVRSVLRAAEHPTDP